MKKAILFLLPLVSACSSECRDDYIITPQYASSPISYRIGGIATTPLRKASCSEVQVVVQEYTPIDPGTRGYDECRFPRAIPMPASLPMQTSVPTGPGIQKTDMIQSDGSLVFVASTRSFSVQLTHPVQGMQTLAKVPTQERILGLLLDKMTRRLVVIGKDDSSSVTILSVYDVSLPSAPIPVQGGRMRGNLNAAYLHQHGVIAIATSYVYYNAASAIREMLPFCDEAYVSETNDDPGFTTIAALNLASGYLQRTVLGTIAYESHLTENTLFVYGGDPTGTKTVIHRFSTPSALHLNYDGVSLIDGTFNGYY